LEPGKPDLVAPVPFATFCRSQPFSGTSAAAPQAAGLAALCWGRYPKRSAAEIRLSLYRSAHHLLSSDANLGTGYGMIGLPTEDRAILETGPIGFDLTSR
jgi:subtilisin family serine protease